MLQVVGVSSLDRLIDEAVPSAIRRAEPLVTSPACTEYEYLQELRGIAARNRVLRSFIGLGYSDAEVLERVALELAACLPRKVA